jgi:large subunit ribosomal protein L32
LKFFPIRAFSSCFGAFFGAAFSPTEEEMAQPKRKNSKQRSHKRRGAQRFQAPQLARSKEGNLVMPHHVDPATGMYRGREVIEIE